MGKVSYANLKLKTNKEVKVFNFMEQEIEILQYLPARDKEELIKVVCEKAMENGVYNPFKVDLHFQLQLVYAYSNLSFTDKQKEDEYKIYDTLKSNGFYEEFYGVLNEDEYSELFDHINNLCEMNMEANNGMNAMLKILTQDLPTNAQDAADIMNQFNMEDYQAVIDFAQAANGGRPIE